MAVQTAVHYGCPNSIMTGCPVWLYSCPDSIILSCLIKIYILLTSPLKLMRLIKKHQFANEKLITRPRHRLGKDISKLKICGDVGKGDNMTIKNLTNGMTIHLNMLCTLMENRISSNLNGTSIIGIERSGI